MQKDIILSRDLAFCRAVAAGNGLELRAANRYSGYEEKFVIIASL